MANRGQQPVEAYTDSGVLCSMVWQITDEIRRPLLATSGICKNNNYVLHDYERGWIISKETGNYTEFKQRNGVYVINLWVQVFPRQGR